MASLRLKDLHSRLEYIDDFENPKIELEQYITTPHVAGKFVMRGSDKMYSVYTAGTGIVQRCTLYGNATHIAKTRYRTCQAKKLGESGALQWRRVLSAEVVRAFCCPHPTL